jgi:arylsulfatase A-like enzyme
MYKGTFTMKRNVIVIMFDTLSYRYLGCYGNKWIKTPNMDKLSREGVLFENCYTEGLPTIPCRRAMFTGRFTLPTSGWSALGPEETTITDLCWGHPIDKALIFDNPQLQLPKFGYSRGFDKVWFIRGHESDDYFYEQDSLLHMNLDDYIDENTLKAYTERVGEESKDHMLKEMSNYLRQMQYWKSPEDRYVYRTINSAVSYLDQVDRSKQFFMWVDSFDPHEPWAPPSVFLDKQCPYNPDYKGKHEFHPFAEVADGLYTEEQLHHQRMLYAELVTVCDDALGKLMEKVRRMGLEENTLFMLVSDHGSPQGNGEHGHGIIRKSRPWPYDELAHTPMLLRGAGIEPGQRIKSFVQSCDVAPTVCEWLGIDVPENMQGRSLLPLVLGQVDKVHDFSVAGYHGYSWAIYTDEWCYIHWLTNEEDRNNHRRNFFIKDLDTSHLTDDVEQEFKNTMNDGRGDADALAKQASDYNRTLDREDQWTCTPGSSAELPVDCHDINPA